MGVKVLNALLLHVGADSGGEGGGGTARHRVMLASKP